MALYSLNMLDINLILYKMDVEFKEKYADMAVYFFKLFLEIADSMNAETGKIIWFCLFARLQQKILRMYSKRLTTLLVNHR